MPAMPRNKPVQPRLTATSHAYLQDLVETGAYGSNPTDVARTLIEEGIRRALKDRIIKVRRSKESERHDSQPASD